MLAKYLRKQSQIQRPLKAGMVGGTEEEEVPAVKLVYVRCTVLTFLKCQKMCCVVHQKSSSDILDHEANDFHNASNHLSKSFLRVWGSHPSPVRGHC